MTDKEKLEKIKALADKMYSRMAYLTSDTRPIRQAMYEYHQFIVNEFHKEEHVSEKECMYSKDNYTDEDRIVLCDGCEEECKFNKKEEPVSEDLEEAIGKYCSNPDNFISYVDTGFAYRSEQKDDIPLIIKAIKFGAQWKEQQMMAKAVDATVHIDAGGYPYIPQMELYDYGKDIPFAKEGDKYKVILIKED